VGGGGVVGVGGWGWLNEIKGKESHLFTEKGHL